MRKRLTAEERAERKRKCDREYARRTRTERKAYMAKWLSENRDRKNAMDREYKDRLKLRGYCRQCGGKKENRYRRFCDSCVLPYNKYESDKQYRKAHPENVTRYGKTYITWLKKEVYEHYGNMCSCCRESEERFLSIDHIGGWRKVHVGSKKRLVGTTLYKWIIDNGFPTSVRLLCMNCNWAIRFGEECPHQTASKNFCGLLQDAQPEALKPTIQ